MHARRGKPDHHVAGLDIGPRQNVFARDGADGKSGKVVIAALIDARHFRRLAADQRAARLAARRRDARHHRGADRRIELAAGEIVEKEQRLSALHHEVVDRHGDEIDADRVVAGGFDRDLDLGAHAVGRGNQDRIGEAGGLEIEQAAKAADFGVGAGARRPAHQRLDQFHHAIAGIDIDAGGRVARLIHGATKSDRLSLPGRGSIARASYVGIAGCASARAPVYCAAQTWRAGSRTNPARACRKPGRGLSIPNLITLGRILLVPVVVWAITSGEMRIAFLLFLAAGISDAVDGFLAKRFHMTSELGAYLDPLADKALIVSIYVSLGIAGALPIFLVILVVSRDIMIISAFLLAWLVDKPMPVRPLLVSKANTVAQICLAALVLAEQAFGFDAAMAAQAHHGAGRHLDLALDRLLSRGVGPPYEFVRRRALIAAA